MQTHMLVPQGPLVFRSGRPFGAGSRDGAHFPWPSSIAGLMRTQILDDRGWQISLNKSQIGELQAITVAGPLLARRQSDRLTVMMPKPADAVLLQDETGTASYRRLLPGEPIPGTGSDLPPGLAPLYLPEGTKGKPQPGANFWPLDDFLAWRQGKAVVAFAPDGPDTETRTHVAIDRTTLAADAGRLFQTEGLDFSRRRRPGGAGFEAHDWILLCRCPQAVTARMVTLGGERRLSWLEPLAKDPLALPESHTGSFGSVRHITLTLATPALFQFGWKAAWMDGQTDVPGVPGLRLLLRAAAVDRWQGISGWDLAAQQAKPARKAVAAGATYWLEIAGEPPADWARQLWLTAVSDHEQDRRDGFGLAVPGLWIND